MKTFTIVALLSTLAVGSSIPRSLIPLPSPVSTTTIATSTASVIPLPTVVHTSNDYHHMIDLLRASGGGGQTGGQSTGENKREEGAAIEARKEDCWERVEGWCAPYCDDMYPGPDKGAKRQACSICIAVQSAFCLA